MKTATGTEVLIKEYKEIIGKRILGVRELSAQEMKELYWQDSWGTVPAVFILEGGHALIPSQDPEGNGPGFLMLMTVVS